MRASAGTRVFAGMRSGDFVFSPVRGRNRAKSFELVPGGASGTSMGMKPNEPTPTLIADEAALRGWIDAAQPGERFVYHQGLLVIDRAAGPSSLPDEPRIALDSLAGLVMALAEDGRVLLAQRRQKDGRIAYLAIKAAGTPEGRTRP